METIWNQVKQRLKNRIADHSYRMWVEPMTFVDNDADTLRVTCPNSFSKNRVENQFKLLLIEALKDLTGRRWKLNLEVVASHSQPKPGRPKRDIQLQLPPMGTKVHSGRFLRNEFTFEQFVVGGNNDFAYSASMAMASRKGSLQNSLLLLSKTGMGKSHLSQAVGHFIMSRFPDDRVYYITAEDFTNELIRAFRHGDIDSFKQKYRNGCDVLLLEDVHYLSGKSRTQIELAHTLDTLLESNKKVIFSSCYLPAEIPKLDDGLRSRLCSGLISNIDPPDFRTRTRILEKKAQVRGCRISTDVVRFLAAELTEDVRQLESGLIGVEARSSLMGIPIDVRLAESVVENIRKNRKRITVAAIKKLVCKEYNVSAKELISRSRKKRVVRPRQVAIFLARKLTDAPLQAIGKSFNRYHATALHSIAAVEKNMRSDHAIRKQVDMLTRKLETGDF